MIYSIIIGALLFISAKSQSCSRDDDCMYDWAPACNTTTNQCVECTTNYTGPYNCTWQKAPGFICGAGNSCQQGPCETNDDCTYGDNNICNNNGTCIECEGNAICITKYHRGWICDKDNGDYCKQDLCDYDWQCGYYDYLSVCNSTTRQCVECHNNQTRINGTKYCEHHNGPGYECINNMCQEAPCSTDSDCSSRGNGKDFCSNMTNYCVECDNDAWCKANEHPGYECSPYGSCQQGPCSSDDDCGDPYNKACNETTSLCQPCKNGNDTYCDGSPYGSNYVCMGKYCQWTSTTRAPAPCSSNSDCRDRNNGYEYPACDTLDGTCVTCLNDTDCMNHMYYGYGWKCMVDPWSSSNNTCQPSTSSSSTSTPSTSSSCTNDTDCGYQRYCNNATSQCVECLTNSTCQAKQNSTIWFCNAWNSCEMGDCRDDRDCPEMYYSRCNTTSGECVQCLPGDDTCASLYYPGYICYDDPWMTPYCVQGPCSNNDECNDGYQNYCDIDKAECVQCLNNNTVCQRMYYDNYFCNADGSCEESPCYSKSDCLDPSKPVCDIGNTTCVQCLNDTDCVNQGYGSGATCYNYGGGMEPYCSGGSTSTRAPDNCTSDYDCMSGYNGNYVCLNGTNGGVCGKCNNDNDCYDQYLDSNYKCSVDMYWPRNNYCYYTGSTSTSSPGGNCTTDDECAYVCLNATGKCGQCNDDQDCQDRYADDRYRCDVDMYYPENNYCKYAECLSHGDCNGTGYDYCNTTASQCVQCIDDSWCSNMYGDRYICTGNGWCNPGPCTQDSHCSDYDMYYPLCNTTTGNCYQCDDGDDQQCVDLFADGYLCGSGYCYQGPCTDDTQCNMDYAQFCNETTQQCVECKTDEWCQMENNSTAQICRNNYCDQGPCTENRDCKNDMSQPICNTRTSKCVQCLDKYDCMNNDYYGSNYYCRFDMYSNYSYCERNYSIPTTPEPTDVYITTKSSDGCTKNGDCYGYESFCNTTISRCVQCMDDSYCSNMYGDRYICTGSGYCNRAPCTQNSHCSDYDMYYPLCNTTTGECYQCDDGDDLQCTDLYADGYICGSGGYCYQGPCTTDDQCNFDYQFCNETTNNCVECKTDEWCQIENNSTGQICQHNYCTQGPCTENRDCKGDSGEPICNTRTNKCVACLDKYDCMNNDYYGSNYYCRFDMYSNYSYCERNYSIPTTPQPTDVVVITTKSSDACTKNDDCYDGYESFCNTTINRCVQCISDNWCKNYYSQNYVCQNNWCTEGKCSDNDDCYYDNEPICNSTSGRCVACLVNGDCGDGFVCNRDMYGSISCDPGSCTDDGECDTQRDGYPPYTVCGSTTGVCAVCNYDDDCADYYGDDYVCNTTSNECVRCVDDGDCGLGLVCETYTWSDPDCVPGPCENDYECGTDDYPVCGNSGYCAECKEAQDCLTKYDYSSSYKACNTTTNQCIECASDDDCDDGQACSKMYGYPQCVAAGCTDDKDCGGDYPYCDTNNGTCAECDTDEHCDDGYECKYISSYYGKECYSNTSAPTTTEAPCSSNDDCDDDDKGYCDLDTYECVQCLTNDNCNDLYDGPGGYTARCETITLYNRSAPRCIPNSQCETDDDCPFDVQTCVTEEIYDGLFNLSYCNGTTGTDTVECDDESDCTWFGSDAVCETVIVTGVEKKFCIPGGIKLCDSDDDCLFNCTTQAQGISFCDEPDYEDIVCSTSDDCPTGLTCYDASEDDETPNFCYLACATVGDPCDAEGYYCGEDKIEGFDVLTCGYERVTTKSPTTVPTSEPTEGADDGAGAAELTIFGGMIIMIANHYLFM